MIVEPKATLEDVAHHEAAHAVAHFAVGWEFESVRIIPGENKESLGGMSHKLITLDEFRAGPRKNVHDYIFICLAGPEWDRYRTGKADPLVCRFDWNAHNELMLIIPPEERHDDQTEIRSRVQAFVSDPIQQARIKALAQALLERDRLTYEEARDVVSRIPSA